MKFLLPTMKLIRPTVKNGQIHDMETHRKVLPSDLNYLDFKFGTLSAL